MTNHVYKIIALVSIFIFLYKACKKCEDKKKKKTVTFKDPISDIQLQSMPEITNKSIAMNQVSEFASKDNRSSYTDINKYL